MKLKLSILTPNMNLTSRQMSCSKTEQILFSLALLFQEIKTQTKKETPTNTFIFTWYIFYFRFEINQTCHVGLLILGNQYGLVLFCITLNQDPLHLSHKGHVLINEKKKLEILRIVCGFILNSLLSLWISSWHHCHAVNASNPGIHVLVD